MNRGAAPAKPRRRPQAPCLQEGGKDDEPRERSGPGVTQQIRQDSDDTEAEQAK